MSTCEFWEGIQLSIYHIGISILGSLMVTCWDNSHVCLSFTHILKTFKSNMYVLISQSSSLAHLVICWTFGYPPRTKAHHVHTFLWQWILVLLKVPMWWHQVWQPLTRIILAALVTNSNIGRAPINASINHWGGEKTKQLQQEGIHSPHGGNTLNTQVGWWGGCATGPYKTPGTLGHTTKPERYNSFT